MLSFGNSITYTYFSLYVFELGGTETTIGLISAIECGVYALSIIVGGQIADIYGRKKVLGVMTIAVGISQTLMAIAPNWQFLAFASTIIHLCYLMDPALWAMLADSIDEKKRGTAFSIFSCINFLPWTIMPFIGGYLIDMMGVLLTMRWAYFLLVILGVASGVIRFLMLEETIESRVCSAKPNLDVKELWNVLKSSFTEHVKIWMSMPSRALALAITYPLWAIENGLVEPYWIVYAEEEIGLSSSQWGTIIALGNVADLTLKAYIVGKILDRFKRKKVLLVILALSAIVYPAFISCKAFIQVLTLWIFASIVWAFFDATYSSIEADMVPKELRGRTFAAFGVSWAAFRVPASLIGGFIYEQVNPQLSFMLASVVVIICLIITAKFI